MRLLAVFAQGAYRGRELEVGVYLRKGIFFLRVLIF